MIHVDDLVLPALFYQLCLIGSFFKPILQSQTSLWFLSRSITVQQPNLSHPFHLHGYAFNVIGIGRSPDRNVKKINLKHALDLDKRGLLNRQFDLPPAKDTVAVPNNGYVIFRFRADNPGKLTRTIEGYFRAAKRMRCRWECFRSRNRESLHEAFAYTDIVRLYRDCIARYEGFSVNSYVIDHSVIRWFDQQS